MAYSTHQGPDTVWARDPDLPEPDIVAVSEPVGPTLNLMLLLSGNQSAPKKKRKKLDRSSAKDRSVAASTLDPELKDLLLAQASFHAFQASFDAASYERTYECTQRMLDLEQKMYSAVKSVPALVLLLRPEPAPEAVPILPLSPLPIEIDPCLLALSQGTSLAGLDALLPPGDDDTPLTDPLTSSLEPPPDTIVVPDIPDPRPQGKTVNARDIFAALPPRRVRKQNGDWSLKVTLKVSSPALAAIKKYDSPFATKGSGLGLVLDLITKRKSLWVSLKVPHAVLAEAAKSLNPLYTKSSGQGEKSARSVFDMMMKSAAASTPRLTAIQKLKGLLPPPIQREHMHVVPEPHPLQHRPYNLHQKAPKPEPHIPKESFDFQEPPVVASNSLKLTVLDSVDLDSLILERAPLAATSAPHRRIVEEFIKQGRQSHHSNWPQAFQPKSFEQLLLPEYQREFLEDWIRNAFSELAKQSTKSTRLIKARDRRKKDDFLVDDDYETEEDVFVPLLIVHGNHGSGKLAAIYSAMSQWDGYVHEINSSQQRARRDIHGQLREFCTTQIIHKNDETRFQNAVVLFEDCDILFEQDKTFWVILQDVIGFSRRPIVVTVRDVDVVPKNIWDLAADQDGIIALQLTTHDSLCQYLWLCSLSQGFDLSHSLLAKVVHDSRTQASAGDRMGYDLRKALMTCQWLCGAPPDDSTWIQLLYEKPPPTSQPLTLAQLHQRLDLLSIADVLDTNTHLAVHHDIQANELLDIYVVDESTRLKQMRLPHEVDIGAYIAHKLGETSEDLEPEFTYNSIRLRVANFLASRAKKLPRILQDLNAVRAQTRSRSSEFIEELPETQGLMDSSICYNIPPQALYTELAPMARYWARLQGALESTSVGGRNLLEFLGWRKFYDGVKDVLATFAVEERY